MKEVNYIRRGEKNARILEVRFEDKKFMTPTYFPSISSVATKKQILLLAKFFTKENYPRLLISAYDLNGIKNDKKRIIKILKEYIKKNTLFIDSGTYESYWLNDPNWNFCKYKKVIKELPTDFYASFDEIPEPGDSLTEISSKAKNFIKKSSNISKINHCIAVLHGDTPSKLIKVVNNNVKDGTASMYAIPERDCGKTIYDKIKTIKEIRSILSEKNPTNILHILGCGNPLSMMLFTFAGADSFDSIGWSRWIINPKTLQFMDLNHIELIKCGCKICRRNIIDITSKAYLHNLLFYQTFTQELQLAIKNTDGLKIIKKYVDQKTFNKIVKSL